MDVLVVEDDHKVAKSIIKAVLRHAPACRAGSVQEAVTLARQPKRELLAAIVDIGLPDGSGLDLTKRLLTARPALPVLVLTGRNERALANQAQAVGARFAFKPVRVAELDAFLLRALAATPDRKLAAALDGLAREWALSPREVEIVRGALGGHPRAGLASLFDLAENTLKTQIRNLLNKTDLPDLDAVVRRVFETAVTR